MLWAKQGGVVLWSLSVAGKDKTLPGECPIGVIESHGLKTGCEENKLRRIRVIKFLRNKQGLVGDSYFV